MMRLFINAAAATGGGGLTYLRNVIPQLEARSDVAATIVLAPSLRADFAGSSQISFLEIRKSAAFRRFAWEQTCLPAMIRKSRADVLLSTGNFALLRSPVPQILLARNSLYTSDVFLRDLRARREYSLWLDTRLKGFFARQSIRRADAAIAPSEAFAADLHNWAGVAVAAVHHGFDRTTFFDRSTALSTEVQEKISAAGDCLRLLFVSHYNYYRNFETLLRALPMIQERAPRPVTLFLTCRLHPGDIPGGYSAKQAAALVTQLGISDAVVELGAIPYGALHHLYSACDVYVTPAYAESFAHPLVEAMSCGVPVVASDTAVHREICGSAALYFVPDSPEQLAERVLQIAAFPGAALELSTLGQTRSLDFSWQKHVDRILAVAAALVHSPSPSTVAQVSAPTTLSEKTLSS